MRIIIVPPYQNPKMNWGFLLRELVANLQRRGQLEGVEVDIDEGYLVESTGESRDEESRAIMSVGIIRKAKEYSETGKYDAVILSGGTDPGFAAARLVSKIPVTASLHSGLHVASLIGERCGHIHALVSSAMAARHSAVLYGLSHKLVSARFVNVSTTYLYGFLSKYKDDWEGRLNDPDLKKIIEDIVTQCIAAIEKDRADCLIFSVEPLQAFDEAIRQRLNEAGYVEIPIICGLSAGVEMAKAMVNMKLTQTARAYPNASLKVKPEYC